MASSTVPIISEDTPLPEAINIEEFKHLVIGYLVARADLGAVTPYHVSGVSNLSESIVILNSRFLEYMGMIEHAGQGQFKLRLDGANYARALMWRSFEAPKLLLKIVEASPLFQAIIHFLNSEESVSREKLEFHIASSTKSVRSANKKIGITTIIDMLTSTGRVIEKDGKLMLPEKSPNVTSHEPQTVLLPSNDVKTVLFQVDEECYAVEREALVQYIRANGRRAANDVITLK